MSRHCFGGGLVTALILATGAGCASFTKPQAESLHAHQNQSVERLLAMAQAFEGQNRYSKAREMYSLVLRSNRNHPLARERMEDIAALQRGGNPRESSPTVIASTVAEPATKGTSPESSPRPARTLRAVPFRKTGHGLIATAPIGEAEGAGLVHNPVLQLPYPLATNGPTDPPTSPPGRPEFATEPVPGADAQLQTVSVPRPIPLHVSDGEFQRPTESRDALMAALNSYIAEPSGHIAQLIKLLSDSDPDIRALSAFLIGQAGESGRSAISFLQSRLELEKTGIVRVALAEAIICHDARDSGAFEVVRNAMSSDDETIRSQALLAASAIAGSACETELVGPLVDALRDGSSGNRAIAALTLGDLSDAGDLVVNSLRELACDPASDVQFAAAVSLSRLGRDSAIVQTARTDISGK